MISKLNNCPITLYIPLDVALLVLIFFTINSKQKPLNQKKKIKKENLKLNTLLNMIFFIPKDKLNQKPLNLR